MMFAATFHLTTCPDDGRNCQMFLDFTTTPGTVQCRTHETTTSPDEPENE